MPRQSKRRGITCVRHPRVQLESNGEKTYLPDGSWLEQFWCSECQSLEWYLVRGSSTNGFTARLAHNSEMLGTSTDGNPGRERVQQGL